MLFFTRAFLCIGIIVVLAEGVGPADLLRGTRAATSALSPAALAPVAALCRSKPEACMALASGAIRAAPANELVTDGQPLASRTAALRHGKLPELSSRPPAPR